MYHWTLEGFVIPRLAEASIWAEVLPSMVVPEIILTSEEPVGFRGVRVGVYGAWVDVHSTARSRLPGSYQSGPRWGAEALPEPSEDPGEWEPGDEGEPVVMQWDDPIPTECEHCGQQYRYTMQQVFGGDGDTHFPVCPAQRPDAPSPGPAGCDRRPALGRARGCRHTARRGTRGTGGGERWAGPPR